MRAQGTIIVLLLLLQACTTHGGPYKQPGINGYIEPAAWRHANPLNMGAVLNPIFRGWATSVVEYQPADQTWSGAGVWNDPSKAMGPATGQNFDVVSLGELERSEIESGAPPGYITLAFGDPCDPEDTGGIRNRRGYDFAVFENGFISQFTTTMGSVQGQMTAELAYVEVSSNGRDFARFPSVSLTPSPRGLYGTIEVSNVHNLAGKHPNSGGQCMGTPFDLDDLVDHPQVVSGTVDLNDIRYVRIVDVPGSGDYFDDAVTQIDPETWPDWQHYSQNHPIYDHWPTWGSGGFDLEAVGILHEQRHGADINLDGVVDEVDLMLLASAWQTHFGQSQWTSRCDLAQRGDVVIDCHDFAVFASQWRHKELWRAASETE